MNTTLQSLIISSTKAHQSYHQLKAWGYNKYQRLYILKYCSSTKDCNGIMTGNINHLRFILEVA